MFQILKLKLYTLIKGKPKPRGFVNPYMMDATGNVSKNGFQNHMQKKPEVAPIADKGPSFAKGCCETIVGDLRWIYSFTSQSRRAARQRVVNKYEYERFVELALKK